MKTPKSEANKTKAPTVVVSSDLLGVIWKSFLRRVRTPCATQSALWLAQLNHPTFSGLLAHAEQDPQYRHYLEKMCKDFLQKKLDLWIQSGRPEIKWNEPLEPEKVSFFGLSRLPNFLNRIFYCPYFYFRSLTPNVES
jgi:hypothetical protein